VRGRKPQTIISGSAPLDAALKPPAWFSKDARAEWLRVMPILAARNTITEADLPTLENYCTAIGTVRDAQREINKHGLIIESARGAKRNPAFGIQNAAMTTARLCASELGLTPVSRSRPSIRNDNDNDDDSSDLGV
jgi:P27 family predicted phage terminase small subunit